MTFKPQQPEDLTREHIQQIGMRWLNANPTPPVIKPLKSSWCFRLFCYDLHKDDLEFNNRPLENYNFAKNIAAILSAYNPENYSERSAWFFLKEIHETIDRNRNNADDMRNEINNLFKSVWHTGVSGAGNMHACLAHSDSLVAQINLYPNYHKSQEQRLETLNL